MRCEVVLVRHAESVVPRAGGLDEFRRPLTAAGSARAERLVGELALTGAAAGPIRSGGESLAQLTERATSALGVAVSGQLSRWRSSVPGE
ncbi:hypothetical protein [Actinokineospora spheciospongiae]|uniref:hypothetical protein n=1 Tax=Actinokineospora spheciospongiae TaxID=909613 RepID=UPI000D71CD89|nr:hypothetical protein [Actinokineospora spheciospongiae]PWW63076.1 hypothetical protein DFQ13_10466 [Actinokineospora spheciospongiae]